MLWGLFFFVVLVVLEARFPDGGDRDNQDKRYYFFDEFVDRDDGGEDKKF